MIAENKLQVEYYLLNQLILKDIIKGIFDKEYLVEFKSTLLEKPEKLKRTLNIYNNDVAKDMISIKIVYQDFINNKDIIYSYIKEGYQFSVIIDDEYIKDRNNGTLLDIFKYIIIQDKKYLTGGLKERKNILLME